MRHWEVLPVLIATAIVGCAEHQASQVQYPTNLPAIIRQPEAGPLEADTEEDTNQEGDASEEEAEERLAEQPKISNLWEEVDLRMAIQDIAVQSGVNIICDDMIEGTVTMDLNDVPLEKALRMILSPGGFTFKKIEDYYLVGLGTPRTPTFLALSQTEIVVTNRPAEEIVTILSPDLSLFVSAVKGKNCLSITAPPEILDRIKEDVRVIDTPRPLVVIEVLVTEVRWAEGSSMGIDWSRILNVGALGAADFEKGPGWTYTGSLKMDLTSAVMMLAEQGDLELKASPKIVTQSGEEAEINVSKEKYVVLYESAQGLPEIGSYYYYPRFEGRPIESGVSLKVVPLVTREAEIILDVEAEVSDMDTSSTSGELPVVEKRGAKTTVRVKNGETVVIGGLYQQVSREVRSGLPIEGCIPVRIPILSYIPIFSFFFQREKTEKQSTELVIFVTPRIL